MRMPAGIVFFLLGLTVVLIPRYILPVCEYHGFKQMACSHTAAAEMFTGFVIMAASSGVVFSKTKETLRWSSLTLIAAALSVLLIPEAIGYCHNPDMPCNYGTIPALRLAGGLIVILSLTGFFISFRSEKK